MACSKHSASQKKIQISFAGTVSVVSNPAGGVRRVCLPERATPPRQKITIDGEARPFVFSPVEFFESPG